MFGAGCWSVNCHIEESVFECSRIRVEQVESVAEMPGPRARRFRNAIELWQKTATGFEYHAGSTADHLRESSEAIRAGNRYELCSLWISCPFLAIQMGSGVSRCCLLESDRDSYSPHQDGHAITLWIKGVGGYPAGNLVLRKTAHSSQSL